MTTDAPRHPGLRPSPRDSRSPAGWPWARWMAVLVVLLAACLAAFLWWWSASEQRALRTMDPAQRRVLFEETRASFRTMCTGPEVDGLALRCRSQADFLDKFPECDAACRAELAPVLNQPTR